MFQFSDAFRNAALDAGETAIGTSPIFRLRTGTPPANCAAARTGTVTATANLPADFMANASGGTKALSGTWQDLSADASGIAGHFEIMNNAGTVCHWQGLVSAPWSPTFAYVVGQQVHANGNLYRCTVAGTSSSTAPSHTSGTTTDGTVTWQFIQVGTDVEIQNTNVVAGQQVNITAMNLTASGA